jgi:hypothetical protein
MSFLPLVSLNDGGSQLASLRFREVFLVGLFAALKSSLLKPWGLDFSESRSPRWMAEREEYRTGTWTKPVLGKIKDDTLCLH